MRSLPWLSLNSEGVEALRPACASCMPAWHCCECRKSTMRLAITICSSFQMPASSGEMRPLACTAVASCIISAAPPSANWPRCTRWKSCRKPSVHEYMHMGDTTMRFFSVSERMVRGWKRGGAGEPDESCLAEGWPTAGMASLFQWTLEGKWEKLVEKVAARAGLRLYSCCSSSIVRPLNVLVPFVWPVPLVVVVMARVRKLETVVGRNDRRDMSVGRMMCNCESCKRAVC